MGLLFDTKCLQFFFGILANFIDYSHVSFNLLGALGGTVGAIPMAIAIHREGKYNYVMVGFFVMLFSQVVFVIYSLSVGLF